jgi:ATP/maltotriose-dependent transcriptional regulator MalT
VIRQVHAVKKPIPSEVAARLAEHMGEEDLTPRELDVLRHAANGNRNRDIGEKLFISSEETAKVHMIFRLAQFPKLAQRSDSGCFDSQTATLDRTRLSLESSLIYSPDD